MLRLVEVPDSPSPFGPLERLPIQVGMLPPPGQHPFDIEQALARLMGDMSRASGVFRLTSYEPGNVYDIVHVAGTVDILGSKPQARLIILQAARAESDSLIRVAEDLARYGPAVLALASDDREVMYDALFEVYAGIVHNRRLTDIVRSLPDTQSIVAVLACSAASDNSLSLGPALNLYASRGRETADRFRHLANRTETTRQRVSRSLHTSQRKPFELQLDEELIKPADFSLRVEDVVSKIDWGHEGGGAIPLSEALNELPKMERAARNATRALDRMDRQLDDEAARAPRLLNANFATIDRSFIAERQPLVARAEYDLLIDVGPAWDKAASIVRGASEFPSESLPPTLSGGWNVDVVFVSEDFEPHTAATTMFVPD
jgi:hypothetical protein